MTYREDESLRKKWKWIHYDGKRVIMWDMTNIPAYAFENLDTQRATYSDYYGTWCFKGGVGVQLCGWIVNADLWVGAVSDTDYNKKAGYMKE